MKIKTPEAKIADFKHSQIHKAELASKNAGCAKWMAIFMAVGIWLFGLPSLADLLDGNFTLGACVVAVVLGLIVHAIGSMVFYNHEHSDRMGKAAFGEYLETIEFPKKDSSHH